MTHDKSREDKELYDRWRDLCVDQIKEKLKLNVEKRKKNFEDVVTSAAHKILRDKTLEIVRAPPAFRISSTIQTEALDRMCKTIESWPGVHLSQCKKLPPIFKKYWRIADNWWNRQKGKWFGDLFFWPILNYNLHQYCKKILMNKENKVQYDYLFYIFLCDILHSKVSFKKARPNPLIFDLALDKSDKLQKWFGFAGEQHGVVWDITTKNTKKSIKDYAQSWVKAVKDRKLNLYIHFTSVNDGSISKLLNVIPIINNNNSLRDVKIKRNSDSHKSNGSFSFHSDNSNSDNKYIETDNDSGGDEDNNNNNNNNKSEQEIFRLKDKCQQLTYALQQQQYINQQQINALSEMQMNQIYKDQYIAQQQYLNQQQINDYNESQIMQALEQIEGSMQQPQNGNNETNSFIKQELYNDQKQPYNEYNYFDPSISNNNINQPVFLPQPTRYSGSAMSAPQPILNGNNILPPPLKTSVGQQRRQSYHDVLLMKQYYKKDIKPESLQSTNHSTHTTASHSHTTVVSNMPPPTINNLNRQSTPTTAATAASTIVSTPSGSDVSAAASVHSVHSVVTNPNRHFYYPNNNYPNNNYNAMSALPNLQIYGNQHNNYHYQQHYYHLPPPILPQPILTQQMPMSPNLLPPPPPNNSAAKPRRPSQISHPSHPSLSAHSHQSNNGTITPPINSNVHSTNNSFELMNSINSQFAVNDNNMDNNYNNIEVPFDQEIYMDMNIDNILNNLSAPNSMPVNLQTSGSNLSLNANFSISDQIDIGFGSSNPNFNMNSVTNMSISHNGGMSMSNVGMDSDQ